MTWPKISLFECIHSQRAIRRFTDAPVSDETLATVLSAAIQAPSGGNRQPWYFLAVRDPAIKRRLGEWYLEAWSEVVAGMGEGASAQPYRSGAVLAREMQKVPVLILVCIDRPGNGVETDQLTRGASVYPAVQNLMLAARALGLGSVLTTLHTRYESEVKELLGIPEMVDTAALIPLGYPAEGERFGGARRRPLEEVTFYDRWGYTASA